MHRLLVSRSMVIMGVLAPSLASLVPTHQSPTALSYGTCVEKIVFMPISAPAEVLRWDGRSPR